MGVVEIVNQTTSSVESTSGIVNEVEVVKSAQQVDVSPTPNSVTEIAVPAGSPTMEKIYVGSEEPPKIEGMVWFKVL